MDLSVLGISSVKEKQFNKKGVYTVEDLLRFLPRGYKYYNVLADHLIVGQEQAVLARVDDVKSFGQALSYHGSYVQTSPQTPMLLVYCTVLPCGQKLTVTWFHQNYLFSQFFSYIGRNVCVAGNVGFNGKYNNFTITSPDIFEPANGQTPGILPVYSSISGMSNAYLRDKIRNAVECSRGFQETLPQSFLDKVGLPQLWQAIRGLHFPKTEQDITIGQNRLLYEDLIYFALANEWAARKVSKGTQYSIRTKSVYSEIKEMLPYALTEDQSAAIDSMIEYLSEGKRVNALIQGDVGCGKSIIAFIMMLLMAKNGYQAVLMAPTLVLAKQHYEELVALAKPLGVRVVWLSSDLKAKERRAVLSEIETGEAQLVVGTQSVIGTPVRFNRLALTITDEEHKFGVDQRTALIEKAAEGVNTITMTATPIPRSLAQVIYGDTVQLHTIKTMPDGRRPVITGIATTKEKIFRFILKEKNSGHQTYVVCPMIDRSEKLEGVQSVEEVSKEYRAILEPYGVRIATLTGRDSKAITKETLMGFKKGEIDVLVSTTVVEVGVNVPSASMIVVENADRFGLSALHQLRGRVGRSSIQSYCVLDAGNAPSPKAMERLNVMVRTHSGFEIAEEDLRIRGAGDLLSSEQSGQNRYMSLMMAYPKEYDIAKQYAKLLLDEGEASCQMVRDIVAADQKRSA